MVPSRPRFLQEARRARKRRHRAPRRPMPPRGLLRSEAPLGCAYCTTSVVVFAPVEYPWKGTWPSPVLWSKGGRQPARAWPRAAAGRGRGSHKDRAVQPLLCVFPKATTGALRARTDLWPELGRSGPERRGHLGLTDTATGQTFVRKSTKFVSEV